MVILETFILMYSINIYYTQNRHFMEFYSGLVNMAQWVKHSPCKPKDLGLNPQHLCNARHSEQQETLR